jgi:eukaryotic-like serine/threonine-protein kinase
MSNKDWSKVKEIVDAAIRRKPDERSGYLDEACADDADVRREVESLLSSFGKADGFMEKPAVDLTAEAATVELQEMSAGQMIGRYEVVRKLGEGGMGAVYLAKDDKLGRNVAIKVLNKKYERNEENVMRFIREARAASALNHPNILTIHEIGEFEGSQYIVSEFVEGDTLREVLRKESLELNRIIDITKQIAGALGAAHKARIIHRDIKPENVIVRNDGYVKVLDFGLAKLLPTKVSTLSFEGSGANSNETTKGVILGTVSYMSPEQAQGKTVDERTDIFSLGVVLYEMIAGSTPFASDSMAETFANLITKEPPPLGGFTSGVPDEMERIVAKMLSKDPELRCQTMGDCVADLKNVSNSLGHGSPTARTFDREEQKTIAIPRTTGDHVNKTAETSGIHVPWYKRWPVIAAISVLLMGTVGVGLYWFRPDADAGQPQIRSLAVLPLKSLDPNDNALGFGIADAVIRNISQTGEMTVRPASSVRHYLTEDIDAITAAKQLTVDAVLEGTIQRAGDRLRIGVNLLKGDGTSLWTDSFDTQMTDVFTVQDTISQQVASRLKVRLNTAKRARLTKRSTSNPIAYEFYTKGIYSYDQRGFGKEAKSQNDATIGLFKKAVETEPQYALARAKLGEAYTWQGVFIDTDEQEKWCELAKEEIRQASLLDSQLAETHLAVVWLMFSGYGGYQIEAAAKEVLKAQEIDPSIGHGELADIYIHLGLEDLFKRAFERALEIDPTSEYTKREFMISYVLLNRWDDYLEIKQKYFPNEPILPEYYLAKGDIAKAAPLIEKRSDRLLFDLYKTDGKALLLALQGNKQASEDLIPVILKQIDRRRPDYHHITYEFAQVCAINGNVPEAVKWLRETSETGNPSYEMFARDPFLDPIRQSPAFAQFMADLKPQYEKYRSEFH